MDIDTPIERPRSQAEWYEAVERNRLKLLRLVCGLLVLARWVFPFASKAAMGGAPVTSLSVFQRLAVSLILRTLWKAELATHYLVFVVASLRGLNPASPLWGGARLAAQRSEWLGVTGMENTPTASASLRSLLPPPHNGEAIGPVPLDPASLFARLIALKEALEDLVGAAEGFLLPQWEKVFLSDYNSAKRDEGFSCLSVQPPHPSAQRNGAFASTFSHEGEKGRALVCHAAPYVEKKRELFLIPP